MNKIFAKIIINFYSIVFILSGLVVIFIYAKAVAGAFILVFSGVQLLRRKIFGLYTVLFLAFVMLAVGVLIASIAVPDILKKNYHFEMLAIALAPMAISLLTFFFFTRRAMAEEFGLPEIRILAKIDKKELIATGRILLGIVALIGGVLLLCYFIVLMMSR